MDISKAGAAGAVGQGSYVVNCFIVGREGDPLPFSGSSVRLDGYVIVPRERVNELPELLKQEQRLAVLG